MLLPENGVLLYPAAGPLLKQDSDTAGEIGIGRALAGVVVIKRLAGVVRLAGPIQGPGVELGNIGGQRLVGVGNQRSGAFGNARLEKIRAVVAHLMLIGDHVRTAAAVRRTALFGLGVKHRQTVAVEIDTVVVGAAIGPAFRMLAIIGLCRRILSAMHVVPVRKAIQAVGVELRLHDDD